MSPTTIVGEIKNWQPNNQDRICGNYFLSGCARHNKDDPDYVPTLNMGYKLLTTSTPVVKVGRYERATTRGTKRLARELDENELAVCCFYSAQSVYTLDL
ncbi:hypothetical protein DPMN_192505 [Dreissena polymorpha]|uniref:Uncharacterized protein n=1 Tax=Dreissena polymorpha TaxID=45954 RepID=A0A9D3Y7C6_DREPO|nr:hypothetical protein DPMN_192505 [Dreissena polymorpha]